MVDQGAILRCSSQLVEGVWGVCVQVRIKDLLLDLKLDVPPIGVANA